MAYYIGGLDIATSNKKLEADHPTSDTVKGALVYSLLISLPQLI